MPSTKVGVDSKTSSKKATSSDESYGGWFGDIRSLAKSTKDTIFPVMDGLASLIHRSAMGVAAEIAQLERDAEFEADRWARDENYGASNHEQIRPELSLPWEVKRRDPAGTDSNLSQYAEDEVFKQTILELSTTEETFMEPYEAGEAEDFILNEQRIHLIRRLLDIDENLAATHAKLSGKFIIRPRGFSFLPSHLSPVSPADTTRPHIFQAGVISRKPCSGRIIFTTAIDCEWNMRIWSILMWLLDRPLDRSFLLPIAMAIATIQVRTRMSVSATELQALRAV